MSRYDREFLGAHRYDVEEDVECPVLFVGEDNPQSADPRHALYPYPVGCAGYNLAEKITGVGSAHHIATWRTNLCNPTWSAPKARERARELIYAEGVPWRVIIMLGRKVAGAFAEVSGGAQDDLEPHVPAQPFTTARVLRRVCQHPGPGRADLDWTTLVSLPRPSGRCREWNSPNCVQRARALLAHAAPAWYGDLMA